MQNKKFQFGILLAMAAIVLIDIFFIEESQNIPTTNDTQIVSPTPSPVYEKTSDKIISTISQKGTVINENDDLRLDATEEFNILYFPENDQFLISISGSPFETVKQQAEDRFVEIVEITNQEELCELNAIITTPRYANPEESGEIYRLSFCE